MDLSIFHFCKPKNSDPSTEKSPLLTKKQSPDLQEISVSYVDVSAEIKWSLKAVTFYFSLRSCLDLNALFQDMFSHLRVARKFQLSKTEIGDYITFGIDPYFRSLLQDIQSCSLLCDV